MELNVTKAKKDEITKAVKKMLKTQGIEYEEWKFEQEMNFLLNNLTSLTLGTGGKSE